MGRVEGWKGGRLEDGRVEDWKVGRVEDGRLEEVLMSYNLSLIS